MASTSVTATWRDIQALLRARGALEPMQLQPGAEPRELEALERHIGTALPAGLKELLLQCNGQAESARYGLFFDLQFLSVEGIRLHWDNWQSLADDGLNELFAASMSSRPTGVIKPLYLNSRWIPFTHDGGGNHLAVDLDPDAGGSVGQVIALGRDDNQKRLLGTSFGDFLARFLSQLGTVKWTLARGHWDFGDEAHRRTYAEWGALA